MLPPGFCTSKTAAGWLVEVRLGLRFTTMCGHLMVTEKTDQPQTGTTGVQMGSGRSGSSWNGLPPVRAEVVCSQVKHIHTKNC